MLQEKKISTKINYDVLKSLNSAVKTEDPKLVDPKEDIMSNKIQSNPITHDVIKEPSTKRPKIMPNRKPRMKKEEVGVPICENINEPKEKDTKTKLLDDVQPAQAQEEEEEYYEDDTFVAEDNRVDDSEVGMLQMLQQHRDDGDEADVVFGTGYDEDDY
ncbi:hypothetical protein AMK59_4279 [Oryctes borbonicus]|uniref:Uncharacterized protein n=1 Tax=Oryctes borbonicus TaxID=1629725 RepID=A0A0T6B7A6_9SCAR|nr:hypothetical protein AMK59_4279 [Oryctes borbonicus]